LPASKNKSNAINFLIYNIPIWVPGFISFGLLPVFTAYLTPADYGIRSVVLMAIIILQACSNLGSSWVVISKYFSFDVDADRNIFLTNLLFISCVPASIIFTLFLFVPSSIFHVFFRVWDSSYDSLFKIQLFILVLDSCRPVFTQTFLMERLAKQYSWLTLIVYFCSISFSLYFLILKGFGIASLFYGELIGSFLFVLVSAFLFRHKFNFQFRKEIILDVVRIGIPAAPKSFFSKIQQNIDKYILQIFMPVSALGIYDKSQFLNQGLRKIYQAFSNAFSPSYVKNMAKSGNDENTKQMMFYWLNCISAILLFFILFLPEIFKLIKINESFWPCAKYAPILGFQVLISSYDMLYSNNILVSKKTYYLAARSIICGILNFILNLVLIPYFGISGAITASLITYALIFWSGYYISEKVLLYRTNLNLNIYLLIVFGLFVVYLFSFYDIIISLYIKFIILISFIVLMVLYDYFHNDRSVWTLVMRKFRIAC